MTPSASIVAIRTGGAYSYSDLIFMTRTADSAASPLGERLHINQDGRIQLGPVSGTQNVNLLRTNASCAFRIGSNESSKNCFTLQWNYSGTTGSATNYLSFDSYGTNNCLVMKADDKVGVNITATNIEAEFHVNGAIWSSEVHHTKHNARQCVYSWRNATTSYIGIDSNNTNPAQIRLGSCEATFAFNGYVPVFGGVYTNASAMRLKKDIIDIPYGLETVMLMKPRQFTWRDSDQRAIGFIAQEMFEVLPEPVNASEDDSLNEDGTPKNGWGFDYTCLTSVLFKS